MRANFQASLKEVLRHEGGYSNHSKDAGGPTNKGVTQAVYDGYRKRRGQVTRSVKELTEGELSLIYQSLYWDKICGDALPRGVDFAVFDAAVNSGPGRGGLWLQQAINRMAGARRLTEDGKIGALTLSAANECPAKSLVATMVDIRLDFMKRAKNSNTGEALWPTFGEGWSNRLFGYRANAKAPRAANGVLQIAQAMADVPRELDIDQPLLPVEIHQPAPSLPVIYVPPKPKPPEPFLVWLWATLRNAP